MATPEGKVKALIKRRTVILPRKYSFWPVQTGLGSKTLDSLWCINGRFVAIEAKRLGEDYTELQKDHKRKIEEAGGTVFLVDGPTSMDYVMRMLEMY
jgi:hypothetical protein